MSKALFDKSTAMMVISGLLKNPTLLHNQEKYRLTTNDFDNDFYKIIFGAIYNLSMEGLEYIDVVDIDMYIGQYQQQYKIFQENEGFSFIKEILRLQADFDRPRFDMYYDRLKKFTILRDLEAAGFDTKEFYNPNVALDRKDKEEKKLNEITIDEIVRQIQSKVNKIEDNYASRNYSTTQLAAKGIRDLYYDLKSQPEVGPPIDGDILNYIVRGARLGKMYLFSAPTGQGKALPNSTKIPTFKNGFVEVGKIKKGDLLFDRLGNPTEVLEIFPQGKRDVYQITFEDGRTALSSDDHIWSVWNYRRTGFTDYTLKELVEKIKERGYQSNDGAFRYSVPLNQPLQYKEKIFDIDPYVFGLLLGDGTFRLQERNKTLYFSSETDELPNEIGKIMGWEVLKTVSNNYSWFFKKEGKNIHIDTLLKSHPDLINAYSHEKYIPEEYFFGSEGQRFKLLQGLLDSDGHIVPDKGTISMFSTSRRLIEDVLKLIQSLGMTGTIGVDTRSSKYTTGEAYILYISTNRKSDSFNMKRKKEIGLKWEKSTKKKYRYDKNSIIKIEKLDYQEEMTCFLVDNEEHLFLMNDYIVTHNTRSMLGNAASLSMPYLDKNNKIVYKEEYYKTLFVTTEQQADEIQTLLLSYVSGVNERKILYGNASQEEEEKILIAIDIIEKFKDNLIIEVIPDPSIALAKAKMVKHIIQNNISMIFYDYIFSSPGLLGEFESIRVREDVALMMLSNTIKEVATTYNVFIMTGTQLNERWEVSMVRNQNMIRGSRAVADKVDVGMIGIKLSSVPEEEEIVREVALGAGLSVPNMVIDLYKNRRGEYSSVKLYRYFDYGTCRSEDIMLMDQNFNIIEDYEKLFSETKLIDLLDLITSEVMSGGDDDE